ncbi:hypothetical protein BGZ80_001927 [Entomortierella chlamydospora]|uniref:Uncharacterized protein n=1 Tax=Entomortierella chlamydospora TaxID=101097 RepID=A0A9P6N317_9FUNG|nr:hypothetical protein BGZ80_001927 [Entomortierella chlamydospora]
MGRKHLHFSRLKHALLIQHLQCPDPSIHFSTNLSRTITAVAWSPDSKYLLINLGYDKKNPCYTPTVKLIDVQSGEIVFKKHYMKNGDNFHANAVCWFPDSKRFLTAVEGVYCIWDLNGNVIREYPVNNELTGLHLTAIPGTEKFIINTFDTIEIISFDDTVSTKLLDRNICTKFSMTVSNDGAYLAVTLRGEKCVDRPAQIALYDLKSMTFLRFFEAETYIDEAFVIVPTFVGPNMELLCAGSENGKLHYWDIETGELVSVLEEHSLHVGGVSANPGHPGMVASCSDDSLVIIWATKQLQRELKEDDDKWMREHPAVAMPTVNIKKGW